jgi:hypothetical protein
MPWNGSVTSDDTWPTNDSSCREGALPIDLTELEMTYLRLTGEIEESREEVRLLTTRVANVTASLREATTQAELWLNADPIPQLESLPLWSPIPPAEEPMLPEELFGTFDEVSIWL